MSLVNNITRGFKPVYFITTALDDDTLSDFVPRFLTPFKTGRVVFDPQI